MGRYTRAFPALCKFFLDQLSNTSELISHFPVRTHQVPFPDAQSMEMPLVAVESASTKPARMQFEKPLCGALYRSTGIFTRNQKIAQCPAAFPTQEQGLPLRVISNRLRDSEVPGRKSPAPQFLAVSEDGCPMISRVVFGQDAMLLDRRPGCDRMSTSSLTMHLFPGTCRRTLWR